MIIIMIVILASNKDKTKEKVHRILCQIIERWLSDAATKEEGLSLATKAR